MEIESLQEGKYLVQDILGAGGFGITYKCIDQDSGRVCAVKEYMPEAIAARNPQTGQIQPSEEKMKAFLHGKKRFLEEAEILMRMGHIPAVVHVWESFEENGTAYYAMEFLEGTTLKRLMRSMGGKLPYPLACEAIEKAGRGLDMIHRQAGIFHRDISPENIIVMPDGTIKIIDFGSAKLMSVSENQQFSVVLKPGFAPPEQYASNLSQGSFTDVYALAGTFYYAASGRMIPVAPDRLMGVEYESLSRLVPECSAQTAAAVDRALLLDAKFRTQTISEFIDGIFQGITGSRERGQTRKPVTESPRKPEGTVAGEDAPVQKTVETDSVQTQPRKAQAWLEVVAGECAGKRFPVYADVPVTVGRSSKKSQIVLSGHPEISGYHFKLLYAPQKAGFYVIDESVNGLYYQGIRLEKGRKYKVFPGERIGVGSQRCVITVGVEKDGR